jgi:hypothetical protein
MSALALAVVHKLLFLARCLDTVDKVLDARRHHADRCAESNRIAKNGVPPHRQSNPRWAYVRRLIDVRDVVKRNAFFLSAVTHDQCVARI